MPVRAQLYKMGAVASVCVICGLGGHGVFHCPRLQTAQGQELWAAWDKKWLLLTGQELLRYALCDDDAEYKRRAAALAAPQPVDYQAVRAFQREHGTKQSARGYEVYQPPPPATSAQQPSTHKVQPKSKQQQAAKGRPSNPPARQPQARAQQQQQRPPAVPTAAAAAKTTTTAKKKKKKRKPSRKKATTGNAASLMQVDAEADAEVAGIMAVDSQPPVAMLCSPKPKVTGASASAVNANAGSRQAPAGKVVQSPKGKAKETDPKGGASKPSPRKTTAPQILLVPQKTSRGTNVTPPPAQPSPSASASTSIRPPAACSSSSSSSSSLSSPSRAQQQANALLPPLLPSPKSSFQPVKLPNHPGEVGTAGGRHSRGEQPCDNKSVRALSSSAPVPTGKTGRSVEDVCVPSAGVRGEVPIGSTALVVVSQSQASSGSSSNPTKSRRPFEKWNTALYLAATHDGRKRFWERAADHKRSEVASDLSRLPERHEVFQEARLDFNAEKWGLCASGASPAIDIDGAEELGDDDESDHGVL